MSGVAVPSPAPRRIATPSWLDLRLVLGVVLVLASVLIGATIVSSASDTSATVAATRDLAAGTVLRSDDLEIAQVQLPGPAKRAYLGKLDDAVGKKLDRAVARGELVPSAAVAEVDARTTVTVPFAAGNAPELHTGQRIEVWVSTASPSCSAVVLLPDVTVQEVRSDDGGSFSTGTGGQNVVISVDPALAPRVVAALAIDQAQIRAGVLVGAHAASLPSQSRSAGSSPAPGNLPDDLAACLQPSGSR
jgi:hypothetical protein